jgi:hypothetical protein
VPKRKELLTPKEQARLRQNVRRTLLAQMHVLLRRHGWKPERREREGHWAWHKDDHSPVFNTRERHHHVLAPCVEFSSKVGVRSFRTVAGLRRRLKELAQQK